jgi:integrase
MSIRRRHWVTKDGETHEAWIVDYADQAGERHIATFERKVDAVAYDAEVRTAVRAGTHTAPSQSPTVAEAVTDWLERAKIEQVERATLKQYRELGAHLQRRLGTVRLSDLTTPAVNRFRDQLCKTMSRAMAQKILTALKGVLTESQRRGLVAQNVALSVTIGPDRRKAGIESGRDFPTPEEIQRILAAAEGRARPFLLTAALTGLRASELRGLRWDDVDLKRSELHVRQRADRYGVIGRPKSRAGQRTIPLGPIVVNTLKAWRLANGGSNLVFPTRTGKPIDHSNLLRRLFAPAQISAGVVTASGRAKYGLHALRHFYASWCINRRADGGLELPLKLVQARLGHASIQMTADRYGHLFPSGDDGAELAAAEKAFLG